MRESLRNSVVGGLVGLVIYTTAGVIGNVVNPSGQGMDTAHEIMGYLLFYGYCSLVGSYLTMHKECWRQDNGLPGQVNSIDYVIIAANAALVLPAVIDAVM